MAEQWEYRTVKIAWNDEKRCYGAMMPSGTLGESQDIGLLLGSWGFDGWELVSVTVDTYIAGEVSGNSYYKVVETQLAWGYCAFFKRRKP